MVKAVLPLVTALAVIGLSGCGGGGSPTGGGGGDRAEVIITPPASGSAPDLAVGTPSVSDSNPDAGASFTLSATVRNAGGRAAAATTLRYFRSSDATISTSDTAVGTDAVGGLAASGTSAESIGLTAPSSAGTYYYGACVDTVSAEANTANNCSDAVTVTVQAAGGFAPVDQAAFDAGIVGKRIRGNTPTSYMDIVSRGRFRNVEGNVFYTGRYTYRNTGPDSGRVEFVYDDGDRCTWNLTFESAATGTGTFSCTDGTSGTTDWRIVSISASNAPDLVVQSPSVSDSSPDAGASITLSATVRNQGNGRSALTTLRYYRSTDATISTSDTAVGTDAVGGLAASGSSAESIRLTAPSAAGTYYYGACVDTVSGESDTANNCSSAVRVTVSASGGGGNSFGVGDALPGVPTSGGFVPAVVSGASVSSSSGTTTITWFRNGGRIQLQNGTSYTCQTAGGCAARNGVVTRGTIVRGGGAPPPSVDPDLVVQSPSVSDSSPDAGQSFTFNATVRNRGGAHSAATKLNYYRDYRDGVLILGTHDVGSLAAGAESEHMITHTAPSDAGTYYYKACVERVSGEPETKNNCSSAVTVTVQAAGGFAPSDRSSFDRHTVGRELYAGWTLRFMSSGRFIEPRGVGQYSGSYNYSNTGPNTGTLTLTYDQGQYGGSCTIRLTYASPTTGALRYTCASGLQDQNNWRIQRITESNAPDLVVQTPTVSDSSPDAGTSFALRATVRNAGAGRSAATTLRYYRSTDAAISASDTEVGTDPVGGLAASGTSAESVRLTAPSSAGTYYYGACVDIVSGDSDTANNCSSAVRVTVQAATAPDLAVGTPSVSDGSPDAGASFTLSATVRNAGAGRSVATTLRYYRSTDAAISASDTEVGTDTVGGLATSGTSAESIRLTAPSSAGTYYYGACVDTVSGESNTANNCSSAVSVTVVAATLPPPADSACRVGMTLRPGDRCEGSGGLSGYIVVHDNGCFGGEFSVRGFRNSGRVCGSANLNGFDIRKNSDGSYTILALP